MAQKDPADVMPIERLKELARPMVRRVVLTSALVTRGMSLGVRGLVIDAEERVFLVRHTYLPGFYLPGGGVDRGESTEEALVRELAEEGNIRVLGRPHLAGLFLNGARSRDHVALYVVRAFEQPAPPAVPNREILEAAFFPRDRLPDSTTPATRRRIAEHFEGAASSAIW